jgi:hypothetical protein
MRRISASLDDDAIVKKQCQLLWQQGGDGLVATNEHRRDLPLA